VTDPRPEDLGETPTLEVLVHRGDELVARVLCESEEEAALVVEQWEEWEDDEAAEGVTFEVRPLSATTPDDPSEAEPADIDPTADYPTIHQVDRWSEY